MFRPVAILREVKHRVFFSPPQLDRQAPAQSSSEFLSDFLKVITTTIGCLVSVSDCSTSRHAVLNEASEIILISRDHPDLASNQSA